MTLDVTHRSAIVIGGGIAGLASATLLAREGFTVDLLESSTEVGGRVGSLEVSGFRFDTGPSWYLMPEVFDHYFRLLGTSSAEQLDLVRLDPSYRVFYENHDDPLDVVADLAANLDAFERIEPGAARSIRRYLNSAGDTYRIAISRFLYSNFTRVGSFLAPDVLKRSGRLLRLLIQPLDRFIARSVKDLRLRQLLGYPAVFLGSSPFLTPSLYHLMSHLDLEQGVLYPKGGLRTIIDRMLVLARDNGVRIRTSATATEILTESTRPQRATGVRYTDALGQSHTINSTIVVSAADLHHTETELLPREQQTYPEEWWTKRVAGPGAVLVMLGVRGALPELAHHSLFFSADWRRNFADIFDEPTSIPDPASLYVCKPSATDATVAPAGHENLFVLIPVPADVSIGGAGDPRVERAADAAIRLIAHKAGVPDLEDRIIVRQTRGPADFARDLHSWSGSALGPAHTLRQSAFLRGKNQSATLADLYYAGGSTVPGIGLPMCLISAELVIKRVRNDSSSTPLKEPL
ncbi:MAG: phytoene desaturase [Cryobacterium sp.]|nr:phytoene desaturase [Cryobacterium sp.]